MYDYVVFLLEEGVLGLAKEISDGIKCDYYIEGISMSDCFSFGDYEVIVYL